MGLISAIGDSVEENRDSLKSERSGIGHIQFYQTAYAGKLPAAEVKTSTEELNKKLFGKHQLQEPLCSHCMRLRKPSGIAD
jgi:hypothetical protein